jgi:transposase
VKGSPLPAHECERDPAHQPSLRGFRTTTYWPLLHRALALVTRRGRAQLEALALPPHTTQRRDESLALLTRLDAHIDPINAQIAEAADADDQARRLMTHPAWNR